jgi:hypothetical protein
MQGDGSHDAEANGDCRPVASVRPSPTEMNTSADGHVPGVRLLGQRRCPAGTNGDQQMRRRFLDRLNASEKSAYEKQLTHCSRKYRRESGTMYRSAAPHWNSGTSRSQVSAKSFACREHDKGFARCRSLNQGREPCGLTLRPFQWLAPSGLAFSSWPWDSEKGR